MFLTLEKITTATPSNKSTILINSESILMMDVDTFENKEYGTQYSATRVEVIGFPNHRFYTLATLSSIISSVPTVDMTQGLASSGSQCAGTPGALNFILPSVQYPLIKTLMIFNNSPDETREYVFNPNFIVYAEEVIYYSSGNRQQTGLMISLRDTQPRQILTKLTLNDLIGLIEPFQIVNTQGVLELDGTYLLLDGATLEIVNTPDGT